MSSASVRAPLAARLRRMLERLSDGLVERDALARTIFLAALAGEHSLLIGPPGTAKSALARRLHRAFAEGGYFERLLTRFSVPEELFGPLSISALEQDRYERHTAGFLPEAHIAFIDEVFKANSAILNALLTLLNEREFDNGAGRMRCPLVSVIGATNVVPDDAVADAFFDRFLMRIFVAPVSAAGFGRLLEASPDDDSRPFPEALSAPERHALAESAQRVALPSVVAGCLAELREALAEMSIVVSDRRWVKMVALLKTAAATEGRDAVSRWDVSLLPACIATEASGQARVADWLARRLGVREAIWPPRLTRIVEAFEAQLGVEQKANDLDYDADGRLRFSAGELAQEIGDAKGGAGALRMTYQRRRRYGSVHIDARTAQVDALIERIGRYRSEVMTQIDDLAHYLAQSLWMAPELAESANAHLRDTLAAIDTLSARAVSVRAGFAALPRLAEGSGSVPDPVAHEAWLD